MNKYKKIDAYQPIKFKFKQNQELVPWENTNFLACIFKLGHIVKILKYSMEHTNPNSPPQQTNKIYNPLIF